MKITSLVNYSEFKALLGEAKRESDPLWCRFFYRPLSFPLGWLFYRAGIRANSVSLLSILLAVTASLLMVFGESDKIVIASILMVTIALSDCIDGNVARARDETGPGGEWMDALSGYTVYALLPIALGIHIYFHSPFQAMPGLWIIVGAMTSIANLFLRLIHQKFVSSMLDESTQTDLKGSGSVFSKFSGEMGLVGWMMPTLLVASLTNLIEAYLVFYCFFYVISAVTITLVLVKKVN